eukprot:4868987-Ditylum_brightwellii.AAC.1
MYHLGNLMSGVWIGDLDFARLPQAMLVERLDAILGSVVPYFYHNIVTTTIGSSKDLQKLVAKTKVCLAPTTANDNNKAPPPSDGMANSIAYGCFYMVVDVQVQHGDAYGIIDKQKMYYAAVQ